MKFAHLADCHIGGWADPKLTQLGIECFKRAIDICIKENIGFILIAGDLFDTALPNIDLVREVARILEKLRQREINVYVVPGSHDFSHSGKTMLDVFENSGLCVNVVKFKDNNLIFTEDKTGVKLTGLGGKRNNLEIPEYENLVKKHLENEDGFKIFIFHTTLEEFKPKWLEKIPGLNYNLLPKNFNYYAGGHVHYIFDKKIGNSLITYPGALFPNNFMELERFKHGGFYIVDDKLNFTYKEVKLKDVVSFNINADGKSTIDVENELLNLNNINDKIVLIRINGVLESGKTGDIGFKKVLENLYEKGAYTVLRNTAKLKSKEFEEVEVESGNVEEVEERVVKEHLGQFNIFENEEKITLELLKVLSKEKSDGERNIDFEVRLFKDIIKVLGIEDRLNVN